MWYQILFSQIFENLKNAHNFPNILSYSRLINGRSEYLNLLYWKILVDEALTNTHENNSFCFSIENEKKCKRKFFIFIKNLIKQKSPVLYILLKALYAKQRMQISVKTFANELYNIIGVDLQQLPVAIKTALSTYIINPFKFIQPQNIDANTYDFLNSFSNIFDI